MARLGVVGVFPGLLAFLAVAPSAIDAQTGIGTPEPATAPRVEVAERFYQIEEETLGAVVATLNRTSVEGSRLSQGLTEYRIVPDWRPAASGGVCRVSGLTLHVRIRVTLPEWAGLDDADEQDRARWEGIFRAIRDHEYEHRDLTIRAAEALTETLSGLEARGCSSLRDAVTGSLSIANADLAEEHAELDRSTPDRLVIGR